MYDPHLEQQLIFPDIDQMLQDYVPIQIDIDNTKIKAAALIVQNVDLRRLIGKENIDRLIGLDTCEVEASEKDLELLQAIKGPYAYFTYYRLLYMFHGSYTESGYTVEEFGAARNEAKSVANEARAVGETMMEDVFKCLEEENPSCELQEGREKLAPNIRLIGRERRSSN